jgi:hypothetical protein
MRKLQIACNADHVNNVPLGELNLEKKMEASLKLCLLSAISIPKKAYPIITLSGQSNLVRRSALWNRNNFLRFRFQLLKSYGSGSVSYFCKVTVPVTVPVPALYQDKKSKFSTKILKMFCLFT